MTDPQPAEGRQPPVPVLLVALMVAALAGWGLARSYISAGARECHALFHVARTAADTARVDTTVTPGSHRQKDPRTCGSYRTSARWR